MQSLYKGLYGFGGGDLSQKVNRKESVSALVELSAAAREAGDAGAFAAWVASIPGAAKQELTKSIAPVTKAAPANRAMETNACIIITIVLT